METVASIIDTNEQILSRQIMSRITGEDYDYFALIDADKNRIRFINIRDTAKESTPHNFVCYDDDLRDALPRLMTKEEADACYDRICLASVRHGLEDSKIYEFSFTVTTNGAQYRKQLKYRWLDDSRETIFLTRLDITVSWLQEREQLRKMEAALHAAEAANAAKTEFLSRISHDIRTPINISINMTNFAMQDIEDTGKLKDDLGKIRSANTFLLSLINDVLDVSKIDSGKFEFMPEPYPYEEYTQDIRNMLEPMCAQKHLHCIFERKNQTTGVIFADKVRLRQITLNLLSNAVKFTPEGGTVKYRSDSEDLPDNRIRFGFEITDTGIGMSEEFQKTMFDPFAQEYGNPARPKNMTGTGLGLSIVKKWWISWEEHLPWRAASDKVRPSGAASFSRMPCGILPCEVPRRRLPFRIPRSTGSPEGSCWRKTMPSIRKLRYGCWKTWGCRPIVRRTEKRLSPSFPMPRPEPIAPF